MWTYWPASLTRYDGLCSGTQLMVEMGRVNLSLKRGLGGYAGPSANRSVYLRPSIKPGLLFGGRSAEQGTGEVDTNGPEES